MRDELEHECKAAANAPSEPSPPPPPAPEAPPNVVPIKDTDFAPWHDISGAGGLQGEAPTYRPPGSFRCYGDHPGW